MPASKLCRNHASPLNINALGILPVLVLWASVRILNKETGELVWEFDYDVTTEGGIRLSANRKRVAQRYELVKEFRI